MSSLGVPIPIEKLPPLLRNLRNKAGLSMQVVAKEIGITHQNISNYERGEHEPPLDKLAALLAHYGIHDFAQLQNAIDAMDIRPGAAPLRERGTPEEEARHMLRDFQPWQRFALESMGNRLDEYETLVNEMREEMRLLREQSKKPPKDKG